jgi:hypothetical protein
MRQASHALTATAAVPHLPRPPSSQADLANRRARASSFDASPRSLLLPLEASSPPPGKPYFRVRSKCPSPLREPAAAVAGSLVLLLVSLAGAVHMASHSHSHFLQAFGISLGAGLSTGARRRL